MINRVSKIIRNALFVSVIFTVSVSQLAGAFSTTYFYDKDDSTGGGSTVLIAGNTQYVKNAQAHVRAYFSSPNGVVGIAGGDYCPNGSWDSGPAPLGGTVTKFMMGSTEKHGVYKSKSCNGTKDTDYWEVTYHSMPSVTIGTKTLYYVDITATNKASSDLELQNGFRVYQPKKDNDISYNSSRVSIAQIGGTSGNQVTIQQAPNDGGNRNYYFRFGADCTVTANAYHAVSFYDLDNAGDTSGAQNANHPISLSISEVNDRGAATKVQLAYVTRGNSTRRSYINAKDWVPNGGSNEKLNVYFLLKPGARYMATLTNVYSNNTVQFSTPFDGIYYDTQCPPPDNSWSVSGKTTGPTGNVPVGTTLRWMHYLYKNSGTARPSIQFAVQQWKSDERTYHDLTGSLAGTWTLPASPTGTTGNGFWHSGAEYTTTDDDIGKRICQRIWWRGTSNTNSGTSDTDEVCATVVASPAVHIKGNDVRVGSSFNTADNNGDALIAGSTYLPNMGASYGEYGVFAPGAISGLVSQGGGSLDNPSSNSTINKGLTFANTSTVLGNYTSTAANLGTIPNSAASFTGPIVNDNVVLGATETNNVRVIKTTGDITINGDLTYGSGSGGVAGLPQLILVANNINISPGVKNVNAWLIANGPGGVIDTCYGVQTRDLRTGNCNDQLTINGPVMAKTLKLKRTYYKSASTEVKNAAETINMRGDAYVVAEQLAQQQGGWQTVYTTDLPPRY